MNELSKIIPPTVKGPGIMNALDNEAEEHLALAQKHFETALELDAGKGNPTPLFLKVIIEQNAAMLCQQRALDLLVSSLINIINTPDDESEEAEPKGMAS